MRRTYMYSHTTIVRSIIAKTGPKTSFVDIFLSSAAQCSDPSNCERDACDAKEHARRQIEPALQTGFSHPEPNAGRAKRIEAEHDDINADANCEQEKELGRERA